MSYHITQIPSLIKSLILTRIFFPKVRLIRFPIYLKGKKFINFGKGFTAGRNNRIECYKSSYTKPKLLIGKNVQINDNCHIACTKSIIIGNNTLIASNVFITDHDHANLSEVIDTKITWANQKLYSSEVLIGRNVWIGENVCILKGVTIGDNSVVGAGSVVTKSIPENSISIGSPAKVFKKIKIV